MNGDNLIDFTEASERLGVRIRDLLDAAVRRRITIYGLGRRDGIWLDADDIEVLRLPG